MKILMGNNTLSLLAGSETWTMTMAREFKRLGHEVTVFSPDLGLIATKLEAEDIKCINDISSDDGIKPFSPILTEGMSKPDIIISNHNKITGFLRHKYPSTPIISTVHGILHKNPQTGEIWPEHPAVDANVNQFVAVSEEVKDILNIKYGINSVVIRNPFDLEKFKKLPILNERPKTILVNSNYWGADDEVNNIIKDVARHYDATLRAIGQNFVMTYEVEEIMKDVDIVFGMGRSILEGACMGKLAVCHGRWGTGGVLTPKSVEILNKRNFSGRDAEGKFSSAEELINLIDANYNQNNMDNVYEYIKENHDVKVVAQKYLEIAEKLCE